MLKCRGRRGMVSSCATVKKVFAPWLLPVLLKPNPRNTKYVNIPLISKLTFLAVFFGVQVIYFGFLSI